MEWRSVAKNLSTRVRVSLICDCPSARFRRSLSVRGQALQNRACDSTPMVRVCPPSVCMVRTRSTGQDKRDTKRSDRCRTKQHSSRHLVGFLGFPLKTDLYIPIHFSQQQQLTGAWLRGKDRTSTAYSRSPGVFPSCLRLCSSCRSIETVPTLQELTESRRATRPHEGVLTAPHENGLFSSPRFPKPGEILWPSLSTTRQY